MKKSLFLTSIAGTLIATSLAVPAAIAFSPNKAIVNEDQNLVAIALPSPNSQLSKEDLLKLISDTYTSNGFTVSPELLSDSVATGSKVKVGSNELDLILYGDVTKDGLVDVGDAQAIAKSMLATNLTGLEKLAADVVGDDSVVDVSDAQRIKDFMLHPDKYIDSCYVDDNALLDSVFNKNEQKAYISSFEVTYASKNKSKVTVKLSMPVENPTITINGEDYTKAQIKASNGYTTYTIDNVRNLEKNKKCTLTVKDHTGAEIGTKELTIRELKPPTSLTIPAGNGNKEDNITARNVENARISVVFDDNDLHNVGPVDVTLVVKIKDEKSNSLSFTKEVSALSESTEITEANLSTLADGDGLTVTAYVIDKEGNKSAETNFEGKVIYKHVDIPSVVAEKVTRKSPTSAEVSLFVDGRANKVYYMVKKSTEQAPTKVDVLAENQIADVTSGKITLNTGLESGKSYVLYMVPCSDNNVTNDDVVSVVIPKNGLHKLDPVSGISSVPGRDGVFTWNYDEPTDGLIGYRAVLKKNNVTKAIKNISVEENNEVNFFEELRKESGNDYTLDIYAIGDGETMNSSDKATYSSINVPSVVSAVTINLDKTTRTKLAWTLTGNATEVKDFTLQVAKYKSGLSDNRKYELVETVNNITDPYYDVVDIINANGAGQYAFIITANPNDTVMMSSTSSNPDITVQKPTYNGPYYFNITDEATLQVSDLKDSSVVLKGTLTTGDYEGTNVQFELWESTNGVEYTLNKALSSVNGTFEEEVNISGSDNTKYFKLKTVAKGADTTKETDPNRTNLSPNGYRDSEPVTVKLATIINANKVTYKEYKDASVSGEVTKLGANGITYIDNTVYITDPSSTVKKYVVDDTPEVETIINLLKELEPGDIITINRNKITYLCLKGAKSYNISTYAEGATLQIGDCDVAVSGTVDTVNIINLSASRTKHEFDLTGLTISNTLAVNEANQILHLQNRTHIMPGSSAINITINGVYLEYTNQDRLSEMDFAGSTLTVHGKVEKISGTNSQDNPLSVMMDDLNIDLELSTKNGVTVGLTKATSFSGLGSNITVNSDNNTIDLSKVTFVAHDTSNINIKAPKSTQVNILLDTNSLVGDGNETAFAVATLIPFTSKIGIQADKIPTNYTAKKNESNKVQINTSVANTTLKITKPQN